MLGRRKRQGIDVAQLASSAVEAFLDTDQSSPNGHHPDGDRGGGRLRTAGAVALGAAAVAAGRAVYNRAKRIDLAEIAARAENRAGS